MLENERNWVVRYDLWRARACVVRAEFERNRCVFHFLLPYLCCSNDLCRNVHDPRALAVILQKAEEDLARNRHPDPYIRASFSQSIAHLAFSPSLTIAPRHFATAAAFPGGTKWYEALYLPCDSFLTSLRLLYLFWRCCWGLAGNATYPYVLTRPSLARSCSL